MNGSFRDIDTPRGWVFWWSVVFALNLPLALLLGWGMTDADGRFGIAVGVVWLWVIGLWAFSRGALARRIIRVGGIIIAALQLFPIPHLLVGTGVSLALYTVGLARPAPVGYHFTPLGAFLATLGTGLLLGFAAILPGLVGLIPSMFGWHARGSGGDVRGADWAEDRPALRRPASRPAAAGTVGKPAP